MTRSAPAETDFFAVQPSRIISWAHFYLAGSLFNALLRTGPDGKRQALQLVADVLGKIEKGKLRGLRADEGDDTRRQAAEEVKKVFANLLWKVEHPGADILLSDAPPPTAEYLEAALAAIKDREGASVVSPTNGS